MSEEIAGYAVPVTTDANHQLGWDLLIAAFDFAVDEVHGNAVAHGWWDNEPADVTTSNVVKVALMHTELSEATEALRQGDPPDDKLPEFSSFEVELADAMIRIMDLAGKRKLRLGAAIVAKHAYNRTRTYKHGGKVF